MKRQRPLATITINGFKELDMKERSDLADWIRGHGNWILIKSEELSNRITFRYSPPKRKGRGK